MPSGAHAVAQIRASLGTLAASERRVAEVVLADPRGVVRMTASQLGARADTSATTVIRFARAVGFAGFNELAISLVSSDAPAPRATELVPTATPGETLTAVSEIARRALRACAETVDAELLARAVEHLVGARHVLCLGATLTLPVAEDLAMRLNHLGISADAPADRQIQRMRAMHLGPGDVCVAILQGGTYTPIVSAATRAREAGATVVALTAFAGTPIVEAADIALVTGSDELRNGVAAWSVRLQLLLVVDALVASLAHAEPERFGSTVREITELIEQDVL